MPPLAAHIIQRERVTSVLTEALGTHCLTVLTAPAGYGKTTVAQEVLTRCDKRSFYLPMKPGWQDNADYLWEEVCTRLIEQGAEHSHSLQLLGMPNDDARFYHTLAFCREHLAATPTLLVIDDFQNVDTPVIPRLLESLVYEEVPELSILILSRSKPAMAIESMQLKGYAAVYDRELLAFTSDETRQLFNLAGEPDQELAYQAYNFSNGWAAAIRVCLQSYLANRVLKPIKSIEELLEETFFSTYTTRDQCLLLQLSVLESFTIAQATLLCEENDVSLRLKALYEQNALLLYSPIDDTYSIHSLLRSYLLTLLAENTHPVCGGIDLRLLHRRAGECCLQSGDYLEAMRHFSQAGEKEDLLHILRIFETPGEGIFMALDPEAVTGIMKNIPWDIRALCPFGYLGFVHRYLVRVGGAGAYAMLQKAIEYFLEKADLPESILQKIRGEIKLIQAVERFNDIDAMCLCYEKADMYLQGNSRLVNKKMFWAFNSPHSAFLYLKNPGTYQWLVKLVSEKLVHFQNVSDGSNACSVDLLTAERFLETGMPQKAAHLISKVKFKSTENEQYQEIISANFTLARLHLAGGRTENVNDLFDSLTKPLEKIGNPLLLHTLELCRSYIASICNDTSRIPAWVLQHGSPKFHCSQAHSFFLTVRGKAIMSMKNWARLEAFAEDAEHQTVSPECLFGRLHVLLFKAIAALNVHRHNARIADAYLIQALELAKPDGIVTSIAEYGSHLYPLLQRMCNLYPERRDLIPLSRLTKKYANLGPTRVLKLTLHEMNIMEMVTAGSSNRDIGERLGITPGSAANTLSRIYTKLGGEQPHRSSSQMGRRITNAHNGRCRSLENTYS